MKPKLLRSFLVLTVFWFCATALAWSLAQPLTQWQALQRLADLFPFLSINVPAKPNLMDSLQTQITVLAFWTLPLLVATALSAGTGVAVLWFSARKTAVERDVREKGKGEFRTVKITLGDLPTPRALPRDVLGISSDDDDDEALERMTEKEKNLLGEIMGTLSAASHAYAGEGVSGDLISHASAVANAAIKNRSYPGLSALSAAASELGKITAYAKNENGDWELKGSIDLHSARILATLPAWWDMPYNDRMGLLMSVKYRSSPKQIPDVSGDNKVLRMAWDLLNTTKREAAKIIEDHQAKALESHEVPDILMNAFIASLDGMPFQVPGLRPGSKSVAWKAGSRIYLLEKELNELLLQKLPADVRGTLTPPAGTRPSSEKIMPVIAHLLKVLDERGWLVTQIGETKVSVSEALWIVKSGRLELRRVIILDVPVAYLGKLPSGDSHFELTVVGPFFKPPGAALMNASSLQGLLAPAKPSVPDPAPSAPAPAD